MIVTSKLLESGTIDFDNLNGELGLPAKGRMNPGYCNSKLANAYFGDELSRRVESNGVNVYMVCPGFTYTGLFRNVKRSWFHYIVFSPVALLFLRTAHQVRVHNSTSQSTRLSQNRAINKLFLRFYLPGCTNCTSLCN